MRAVAARAAASPAAASPVVASPVAASPAAAALARLAREACFSAGVSRNHACHTPAHINPAAPKTKNAARHPYRAWIGTTSSGAIAPPIWLAISITPAMLARCDAGNQRDTTIDAFGNAPASPAPKQNLMNS